MKKAENEKGSLISYGIVVLLTVAVFGIFFMGTDGIAQVNNMACQDYSCDGMVRQDGEVQKTTNTEMSLCNDGFETWIQGYYYGGYLYPATDSRHLLGTVDSAYGWGGCSVEFKRRNQILIKLTWIQDDDGWVTTFTCTPCNNCFNP